MLPRDSSAPDRSPESPLPSPTGTGILRCSEFGGVGWETQGLPSATLSDLLRCHDWSYVQAVAKV